MDITFEKLKSNLNLIVEEFRKALNNGDYAKAKDMAKQVLDLYKSTYGIELDTNPEFNHIFHEAMKKMDNEIIQNNAEPSKTAERLDLIKTFAKVADGVFKVADVRKRAIEMDPTGQELIEGYQKGIDEAKEHIEKLKARKDKFQKVKNEIYGTESPNLKEQIEDKKFYIGRLDEIENKIKELDELQKALDLMEADLANDPTLESRLRGNIEANKRSIANGLSTMQSMLDELKRKGVNVDSIKDVINPNSATRMAAIPNVQIMKSDFDKELTQHYTDLMNNIKNAKKNNPEMQGLKDIDFSKMDPKTEEGRKTIDNALKPFLEYGKKIDDAIKLQENHIKVFEESIEQVKEEIKILDIDVTDRTRYTDGMTDDVKAKIREEEEYYRQDMYDKMYGNPEKAEKWKKYLKVLKASEVEKEFVLRDINGEPILDESGSPKVGKYRTIDNTAFEQKLSELEPPVSKEDALKLLQLEEYQARLERITKIRSGDKFSYRELPSFDAFMKATTEEERNAAVQKMNKELDEDMTYLKTNHQAANTHEYMAKAIGDAGSLVKYKNGIKEWKGQGFWGGTKAVAHNALSLLGLRSIGDAKTPLGKVGTVMYDAGMIAAAPAILTTKLIYRYTPIAGKEAQKKRYEKKYSGEHSSPYEGRKDARKMQRREIYKSEMKGWFKGARAWVKANNDNLFGLKRREETEKRVMEKHMEEDIIPSIHNRYIVGAQKADLEKKQKAEENLEIRRDAAREIARRDYTQSDLAAEPEMAENKTLDPRAMQGGVLELNGLDSEKLRYSDTTRPRRTQFTTIRRALGALHGDLKAEQIDYSQLEGSVVQTDAISMATREKGIVSTTTARNYVPYVLTGVAVGMGARYGISKLKAFKDQIIDGGTEKEWKITGYEETERVTRVEKFKEVPDPDTVPKTPEEFARFNDGNTEHLHETVWGGEHGGYDIDISDHDNIVGAYLKIQGQEFDVASPENGGFYSYLGQDMPRYIANNPAYLDPTTGGFASDANIYDMLAEIANQRGITQGLTGKDLLEKAFSGDASVYVQAVKSGRYGGWLDATELTELGTKMVSDGFEEVVKTVKVPVWGWVTKELPDTIIPGSEIAQKVGDAVGAAFAAGHVIEATEKATRRIPSDERDKLDKANKVDPGRHGISREDGR